jgi:hypothetical protein
MGYVKSGWHKKGMEAEVEVRNKMRNAAYASRSSNLEVDF